MTCTVRYSYQGYTLTYATGLSLAAAYVLRKQIQDTGFYAEIVSDSADAGLRLDPDGEHARGCICRSCDQAAWARLDRED